MTGPEVPLIDLAGFDADERRARTIARQIDEALRTIGFFHVVGHGVPDHVVQQAFDASDAFFDLPLEEKLRCTPPSPEVNRGYAALGTESLSYSLGIDAVPDQFEGFNIGPDDPPTGRALERVRTWFAPNIWPEALPELRPALTTYFRHARRVADALTRAFALALGLPRDHFAAFTTHSTDTMRTLRYDRPSFEPDAVEGPVLGMGPHTDYGIVTVLSADPLPGLELFDDGRWHPVTPEPGAIVVNIGDLLALWTNDQWRSTIHRVVPPTVEHEGRVRRRTMPFFLDGNFDAVVECLPTCVSAERPARYAPVRAEDHLMEKLLGPRTGTLSEGADTVGERRTGDLVSGPGA